MWGLCWQSFQRSNVLTITSLVALLLRLLFPGELLKPASRLLELLTVPAFVSSVFLSFPGSALTHSPKQAMLCNSSKAISKVKACWEGSESSVHHLSVALQHCTPIMRWIPVHLLQFVLFTPFLAHTLYAYVGREQTFKLFPFRADFLTLDEVVQAKKIRSWHLSVLTFITHFHYF